MTSPRLVPIFDGHNDVLLRLYRRGGANAPRYLKRSTLADPLIPSTSLQR